MRKSILLSLLILGFVSAAAVPQARADWDVISVSTSTHTSSFEGSCYVDATTGEIALVGTTTLKDGTQVDVVASATISTSGTKQTSWKLDGDVTTSDGSIGGVRVTAKTFYSMVDKFTAKVANMTK